VRPKLVAPMKLLSAIFAPKKFKINMSPLMILLIAIRNECFATEATLERFLPGMCFNMVLQRCAMFKKLEAVFVWTLILEHIQSDRQRGILALFIFGLVFVEDLDLSGPIMDGLKLNLVKVHWSVLILRVFGLYLEL
jgi:hypothetical protein